MHNPWLLAVYGWFLYLHAMSPHAMQHGHGYHGQGESDAQREPTVGIPTRQSREIGLIRNALNQFDTRSNKRRRGRELPGLAATW